MLKCWRDIAIKVFYLFAILIAETASAEGVSSAPPELFTAVSDEEARCIAKEFEFQIERFKDRADRVRAVRVNFSALRDTHERLIFNPFVGVQIPIEYVGVDQISPPISVIWNGRILGEDSRVEALEKIDPQEAQLAKKQQKVSINIIQVEVRGQGQEAKVTSYEPLIVTKIHPAFSTKIYRVSPLEVLPGYHLVSETDVSREITDPYNLTDEQVEHFKERKELLKHLKFRKLSKMGAVPKEGLTECK